MASSKSFTFIFNGILIGSLQSWRIVHKCSSSCSIIRLCNGGHGCTFGIHLGVEFSLYQLEYISTDTAKQIEFQYRKLPTC